MPALKHKQKLNQYLTLGVQIGQYVDGRGYKDKDGIATVKGRGVWTCEIKFPGHKKITRTTKVKYEPESQYSEREATRIALEIFGGFSDRYGRGLSVSSPNYVIRLLDNYLQDVEEDTAYNDSLPSHQEDAKKKMYGGWGVWNRRTADYADYNVRLYIRPFCKERLPSLNREPSARIENVRPRDWDGFDDYLSRNSPHLSIESRLKTISELRKFLHWCYDKEYIDFVPSIKRPQRMGKKGARDRMRKEITPEVYLKIINYTRDQYLDDTRSEYHRDYAFLFHMWILLMANSGIRVPSGKTEHTLVRWEHMTLPKKAGEPAILLRPKEKTAPPYEAMIMPRAVRYMEQLKEFYKKKRMPVSQGYVFVHPHNMYHGKKHPTSPNEIKTHKGTRIGSFRTQWVNMCKKLKLHEFGTKDNPVPQSEKISPSSLRAFFITQRLYSKDNMRIDLLAEHTGTSIAQIQARYGRMDMEKSYEFLAAGAYDDGGEEIITVDGYYAGTRNSQYWQSKQAELESRIDSE